MMISYKYPIFPSNITQWKLAENLDACRWLYNRLLQDLNEAKRKGTTLKTYDSQNMIPSLKLVNPKLNLVYSKVLHIRFKGYGWYITLNYNQSGFKIDQDHGNSPGRSGSTAVTRNMGGSGSGYWFDFLRG